MLEPSAIDALLERTSGFVWGPFLLIPLLLGTGLYLTVRLRGLQFRTLLPALHLALIAALGAFVVARDNRSVLLLLVPLAIAPALRWRRGMPMLPPFRSTTTSSKPRGFRRCSSRTTSILQMSRR